MTKQAALCKPDHVYLATGSEEENKRTLKEMVHAGALLPLNEKNFPGCYLARSTTADVARVESRTYICSERTFALRSHTHTHTHACWLGFHAALRVLGVLCSQGGCGPDQQLGGPHQDARALGQAV